MWPRSRVFPGRPRCDRVRSKNHGCKPEGDESEDESDGVEVVGAEGERIKTERDAKRMKSILDPRKPSAKDVEDHNRTHLPYRNWCPHCVRAKGKDMDHRKASQGTSWGTS